ncbi:MAG: hypothetical protein AB2556_23335 [Candidatus Thiodiazotropha sp.]
MPLLNQVPLLKKSAPDMKNIEISDDDVIKLLKGLNPSKALGPIVAWLKFSLIFCEAQISYFNITGKALLKNRTPNFRNITEGIESTIRLFADVCYRQIDSKVDTEKLQKDIDHLGNWARK